MHKIKLLLSGLLPVVLMVSACSLQKTANDIGDTSKEIKSNSDHLSDRTDDLEREIVAKESPDMQIDKLNALFGDGQYYQQASTAAVSEPDLLLNAGVAVQAMEFQYWNGDYKNNVSDLDADFEQSLEIMFAHTTKHIPRTFEIDVLKPSRDYEAVGALGVKLDREWHRYVENLTAHGYKDLSAYDVIMSALRTRGEVTRHDLLPKTTSMVLQWKDDATYIVQLRHNFYPITVVARMTNLQDQGDIGRLWDSWAGSSVDINSVDPEELKTLTAWLNSALETRQALKDMCIEPQYNTEMLKIVAKLDFGQKSIMALATKNLTPLQKVQRDFAVAYMAAAAGKTTSSPGITCPGSNSN